MPRILDTHGNAVLSIAICDRCKMKRAYVNMGPDPNFPGLRVCDQGCRDQFDPYRLPARQPEKISLRFPRPDVSVAVDPNGIVTSTDQDWTLSPEQNTQTPENNGNLDNLSPSP
jgi:hypothetical protein